MNELNICKDCGSRTDDGIINKDKYNCSACSVEDDNTGEH